MKNALLYFIFFLVLNVSLKAQTELSLEGNIDNLPVHEYTLEINEEIVNKVGKDVMGMTNNGSISGTYLGI